MKRVLSILSKRYLVLTSVLLLTAVYALRVPSHSWNRPIISDGKGYYAYLPAVFIYQDLTYDFKDEMEDVHYVSDKSLAKGFTKKINGRWVNQYFCGLSILWLPFFLLAHILSLLFGLPADGYSVLYQSAVSIAGITYVSIGLASASYILKELGFKASRIGLVSLALLFGSNLFHYAVDAPSMSHVYSFSLIALFTALLFRLKKEAETNVIIGTLLLLGLIILVRPTNGIIAFAIPFAMGSWKDIQTLFRSKWKSWMIAGAGLFMLLGIQPLLWKLQTGNWFIYSYAGESFHFDSPQIINALFSVRKGWFVYTPLALLVIPGWIRLFQIDRYRALSLFMLLFLALYIISSWHLWAYADSFGQRPFVDYYVFLAILLAHSFDLSIKRSVGVRAIVVLFVLGCIALNQIQNYQLRKGIISADHMTAEKYRDSFLQLVPNATIHLDTANRQKLLTEFYAMESKKNNWRSWENTSSVEQAFSGDVSCKLSVYNQYGIVYKSNAIKPNGRIVTCTAKVYAEERHANPVLVFDLQTENGSSIAYYAHSLQPFIRTNKWFTVSFASEIDVPIPENCQLVCYFWLPDEPSPVFLDDFRITIYGDKI